MSQLVMPVNEEEYKRDCRLMYVDDNIGSVLLAEYAKGYNKGYEDKCSIVKSKAEDDRASLLAYICKKYNIPLVDMNVTVDEWEYKEEQKNEGL